MSLCVSIEHVIRDIWPLANGNEHGTHFHAVPPITDVSMLLRLFVYCWDSPSSISFIRGLFYQVQTVKCLANMYLQSTSTSLIILQSQLQNVCFFIAYMYILVCIVFGHVYLLCIYSGLSSDMCVFTTAVGHVVVIV